MNILRRLPLSRLVLLCALVVAIGVSATAIALAIGSGSKPPPKPLAQAVHDALEAPPVEGLSATVTLTNHLLEGANLAAEHGSGPMSSPLIAGASGRLWIAKDGRVRLELKAEKGDTNVIYDGKSVTIYDAAENKVYRYTPEQQAGAHGHEGPRRSPLGGRDRRSRREAPQARRPSPGRRRRTSPAGPPTRCGSGRTKRAA